MNAKIDFALVGAAKSATTSLFRYLGEHDEIFLPAAKELSYFSEPPSSEADERIEEFYTGVESGQLVGIAEANMLMFGSIAGRILDQNPGARIIAILRNPVERAHSGYWFARNRGWEDATSFENALQRELRVKPTSRYDRVNFTHLEHGHYAEQLEVYIGAFGARQVKILLTEDLAADPESTMADLFAWLGVASEVGGIGLREKHNVTTRVRFPRTTSIVGAAAAPLRAVLHHVIPESGRHWIYRRKVAPLVRLNRAAFVRPPMKPETRAWLRNYYQPHNEELARLLDRDLSHWR